MKKIFLSIVLLLVASVASAAPPESFGWKGSHTVTGDLTVTGSVSVGTTITTESSETTVQEVQIENDASEKITAWARTIEMSDETDATEDVIVREYMRVGGTLGMYRSSKVYTAAPSGSEAPVYGCQVIADRATWDPASKGSGGAYLVWWDGDSWEVIDGQVD